MLLRPHRALAALYWYITGRKVRARNRLRIAVAQTSSAYPQWIKNTERLDAVAQSAPEIIRHWAKRPLLSVIVYLDQDATALKATLKSIKAQTYDGWELLLFSPDDGCAKIADDLNIDCQSFTAANATRALDLGAAHARGDYIIPLEPGDQLSPAALFRYAEALQHQQPAVLYGDEDQLNRLAKRTRPWFKPQWNEEMFLAQDYLSAACAIRTDLARSSLPIEDAFASVGTYMLLLRITAKQDVQICHIPHILCHRSRQQDKNGQDRCIDAVLQHLASQNIDAQPGPFDSVRVIWPLPAELPKVSIIVPTRDKVKLLKACVDGLLSDTDYPDFELIIVDNGSVEPGTHRYFETVTRDPRVRVLPYSAPYNYSAINNFAAAQAQGDYLCLLNNDTEIVGCGWLTEMMRYATKSHVGAVGAKLLYADGSIQHAGVIIGMGEAAGHAHRFLRKGQPGYFKQPHLPQYMSAVTAACLVVEKQKFDAVGGLDADNLAIAFNDVDLCLKLEAAGWRNVYAPQAVLIHHESKSRGKDISPQHIDRYMKELAVLQERWETKTYVDPLHNPNLNRYHETFTIRI